MEKKLYRAYLHHGTNFCASVKFILKRNNFEKKFRNSYKTFENTGEMNLMMKYDLCLYNSSEL